MLRLILAFQGMLFGRADGLLNKAGSWKWPEGQGKRLEAAFGDLQVTRGHALMLHLVKLGEGQGAARAHPTLGSQGVRWEAESES